MLAVPLAAGWALARPAVALAAPKPKAPAITGWSPKAKSFALRWRRVAGAKGYQVKVYGDKRLGSVVRSVSTKKASRRVGGLKRASFYYVRVRAYGVSHGRRVYGPWSGKVLVHTKADLRIVDSSTGVTRMGGVPIVMSRVQGESFEHLR